MFRIMRALRIMVPALTVIIIVRCIGSRWWNLIAAIIALLLYGAFMEAFGAYERDVEEYEKKLRRVR